MINGVPWYQSYDRCQIEPSLEFFRATFLPLSGEGIHERVLTPASSDPLLASGRYAIRSVRRETSVVATLEGDAGLGCVPSSQWWSALCLVPLTAR